VRAAVLAAALVLLAGCLGATAPPSTPGEAPESQTAAATALGTPHPETGPTESATVTRVVDGDTVEVELSDGTTEKIRLLGVDTPEVHSENTPDEFEGVPETAAGRDCLRTSGERASAFVEERLAGREVELGFDPTEERRGYYGRLLAYVYVDGEQLNARLVAGGWGRVFDSEVVERDRYLGLEERAQSERRGLWACADGTPAPTPAPDDLTLRVTADAPGDDRENLDGETVTVVNGRDEAVNLSGWTLRDEADHVYRFPEGTTLGPGESLVVHTGSGEDGDGDYYWGRSSPVWNNAGDTATLADESGTVVAERSY